MQPKLYNSEKMTQPQIETILIESLFESPYQGRLLGDDAKKDNTVKLRLKELADSITSSGLLQPISVRKKGNQYEIIDGHRRVEAHKLLAIKTIQAIVTDKSDREVQVMSVVANLQRTNLSNIEKAIAFQKILKAKIFKSQRELSKAIGKDETYVGDVLNLLNLDKRIIEDIVKNRTTNDVRLLRQIRKVEDLTEDGKSNKQYNIYQKFKNEKLSRQEVINLIEQAKVSDIKAFTIAPQRKGYSLHIQEDMTVEQRQRFVELLEQKMQESLDEIRSLRSDTEG